MKLVTNKIKRLGKINKCKAYQCNHPLDPVEYTCDDKGCKSDCKFLAQQFKEEKVEVIEWNCKGFLGYKTKTK